MCLDLRCPGFDGLGLERKGFEHEHRGPELECEGSEHEHWGIGSGFEDTSRALVDPSLVVEDQGIEIPSLDLYALALKCRVSRHEYWGPKLGASIDPSLASMDPSMGVEVPGLATKF